MTMMISGEGALAAAESAVAHRQQLRGWTPLIDCLMVKVTDCSVT